MTEAYSDAMRAQRDAERQARRLMKVAQPSALAGAPLPEEQCPHCGGTGRLVAMTRQERQRLNDEMLKNRRPGDPLPNRANALQPAAVMHVHPTDTDAALRQRADYVLDAIDTSGVAEPRYSPRGWDNDAG